MRPALRRVLLIGGDPAVRDILRRCLEPDSANRIDYRAVDSGKAGLEAIRDWQPDCVLLDLNLPGMPGLEVLRTAASGGLTCPILAIAASESEAIAAEAMRQGAAGYLIKGMFDGGTLVQFIENVLERAALRREVERQRLALAQRDRELEDGMAREKLARAAAEESERRYRSLAEAFPQIVWTARHPTGEFDSVNPAWSRATGAADNDALGHRWMDLLHPDDRPPTAERWARSRADCVPFEAECRLRAREGAFRWNLLRAIPVSQDGQTLTWLGTFTDREEQKRAEQLLEQRQRLESVGLLAGGLAHDFNNLLVGIVGSASCTLDMLPHEHECRSMLNLVLESGERAARLIRQMLTYAGDGDLRLERVDLQDLVRKTWDLVRASFPSGIEVQFLTRQDLPPLLADSSQIEQIAMNLLINAAEAIPIGKPGKIVVRTGVELLTQPLAGLSGSLEPGQYLLLEVRDNGCGMDEATRARIFDPFFSTKFTGRGLGLAAVQGIVRQNGGAILVESSPDRGASFRILWRPGAGAAAGPNVREIDEPRLAPSAGILVVDDEDLVRTVSRAALERAGYTVETVSSGAEAIAMLRRSVSFSLILLDMGMPGMDGIATLSAIRALDSEVPILLCSGYSELEMRRRSEGLAISGFIQKPYAARELRDYVAHHLRIASNSPGIFTRPAS